MYLTNSDVDNFTRVKKYFNMYQYRENRDERIYIDMSRIGNSHIFRDKYAIFQGFNEYKTMSGKVIFNVYVAPINERFSTLSVLVTVNNDNIDNILRSLDTYPKISFKD